MEKMKGKMPPGGMKGKMPPGGMPKGVENPGTVLKRLLHYVMQHYRVHIIVVVVCILLSVFCNLQGTMFIQSLIDDYITPLLQSDSRDFSGLAAAIFRVCIFYVFGVLAAWTYNRLMVNVTQGTLRDLRNDMFTHMEGLPIKYFDTHSHVNLYK